MIYNDICSECQEKSVTGLKVSNEADTQIELSLSNNLFLVIQRK